MEIWNIYIISGMPPENCGKAQKFLKPCSYSVTLSFSTITLNWRKSKVVRKVFGKQTVRLAGFLVEDGSSHFVLVIRIFFAVTVIQFLQSSTKMTCGGLVNPRVCKTCTARRLDRGQLWNGPFICWALGRKVSFGRGKSGKCPLRRKKPERWHPWTFIVYANTFL